MKTKNGKKPKKSKKEEGNVQVRKGSGSQPKDVERVQMDPIWDWDPLGIRREMDRMMQQFHRDLNDFFMDPEGRMRTMSNLPLPAKQGIRSPSSDLIVREKEIVFTAEMPGINKQDIDIKVTEEGIDVRGHSTKDVEKGDEHFYHRERSSSSFHRSMRFPEEVVPDKAQASFNNGVLEVVIPRKQIKEKTTPVKVKVN